MIVVLISTSWYDESKQSRPICMSLKGTFIAWTLAAQNITVLQLGLKKIMPENYQFYTLSLIGQHGTIIQLFVVFIELKMLASLNSISFIHHKYHL